MKDSICIIDEYDDSYTYDELIQKLTEAREYFLNQGENKILFFVENKDGGFFNNLYSAKLMARVEK